MNKIFVLLCSTLAVTACGKSNKKTESPVGYDFSAPVRYEMKPSLDEISGIAFYPGDVSMMYAIQDEDGKLFYWNNGDPQSVKHVVFGGHGDYEDVALTKTTVVVLRSDGTLFTFPIAEVKSGELKNVQQWKNLIPPDEYESLYVDANTGKIIILCKNCLVDRKQPLSLTGYELQLDANAMPVFKGKFTLNTTSVKDLKPKWGGPLKPSALTFNAKTNEWYIVASVNKLLLVADQNWNVKQAVTLPIDMFSQPEGIAFDADNNLYISNEAGSTPKGTVLKFPYKPSN